MFEKKSILEFLIVYTLGSKIVSWLSEGQEFLFLFRPLLPVLSGPMISFEIKQVTKNCLVKSLVFLANQTHTVCDMLFFIGAYLLNMVLL